MSLDPMSYEVLQDIVTKEVAFNVGRGNLFTAYSITTAIRKFMKRYQIIHSDVKEIIQNLYNNTDPIFSNYTTTICISKKFLSVCVYHAPSDDPITYVENIIDSDCGDAADDKKNEDSSKYVNLISVARDVVAAVKSDNVFQLLDLIDEMKVELKILDGDDLEDDLEDAE